MSKPQGIRYATPSAADDGENGFGSRPPLLLFGLMPNNGSPDTRLRSATVVRECVESKVYDLSTSSLPSVRE